MLLAKHKQPLNSTKSETLQEFDFEGCLRECVGRMRSKYATCETYYLTVSINKAIQNKKCKLKIMLDSESANKVEQYIKSYNRLPHCLKEMEQLTEYYKYYTQTSILYHPSFFKLMYQHRDCKKLVEYNKLKLMLNLSDSSEDNSDIKNHTPASSFDLLARLSVTHKKFDEESLMVANIVSRLQRQLGPTRHKTIQEVDNSFVLVKKPQSFMFTENGAAYYKMKGFKKQSIKSESKVYKTKKHRNKSNLVCLHQQVRQYNSKHKISKKKHQSMDNLEVCLDNYGKENRLTPILNTRLKRTLKPAQDVKEKIIIIKQKIKQQKLVLKKKTTMGREKSTIQQARNKMKTKKVRTQ